MAILKAMVVGRKFAIYIATYIQFENGPKLSRVWKNSRNLRSKILIRYMAYRCLRPLFSHFSASKSIRPFPLLPDLSITNFNN